jgi:hypothetical protein
MAGPRLSTKTIRLDQVNQACSEMPDGTVVRGVIVPAAGASVPAQSNRNGSDAGPRTRLDGR